MTECVRRMEDAGYRAEVDPAEIGLPVLALVQLRCDHGRCLLNTFRVADHPEVLEVHKVSGERCAALKVAAQSVAHLDEITHRLSRHGELWTTIILASPLGWRALDWEDGCGEGDAAPER